MSTAVCLVPGCEKKQQARGLCPKAVIKHARPRVRRPAGMTHEEAFRCAPTIVTETGCIEWLGHRSPYNYGLIQSKLYGGIGAHRVALGIAMGQPVPKGKHVLHRCDNPPCVNPEHLFIGTDQDNVTDMIGKSRHAHGEACRQSKLTEAQVREIKTRHAAGGIGWRRLAAEYGVAASTVQKILEGKTWKHVT